MNKLYKNKGGYKYFLESGIIVFVHRRVMEKKLKRSIKKDHEVHHINKNVWDNRPENLIEMEKKQYKKLHLSPPNRVRW